MANEQNLIQNSNRSPSELRENGRKGGIASGESRRLKTKLKKWAEEGGYDKMVAVADENIDNPQFWKMVASLLGEAPADHVEADITQNVIRVTLDD